MEKKGFTLVELMAVLIILGIVTAITAPKVFNSLKTTKSKLCHNVMLDIKDAARSWAGDNIAILPTTNIEGENVIGENLDTIESGNYDESYNTLHLNLEYLQKNGYIDSNIKNPFDDNEEQIISPSLEINIVYKDNNYVYEIPEEEVICSGGEI